MEEVFIRKMHAKISYLFKKKILYTSNGIKVFRGFVSLNLTLANFVGYGFCWLSSSRRPNLHVDAHWFHMWRKVLR